MQTNTIQFLTNKSKDSDNPISQEGKMMCKLLQMHIPSFHKNIGVSIYDFNKNNWDIIKTLYDKPTALFYNKRYITVTDQEKFDQILTSYVNRISRIYEPDNLLFQYLKKWTDMSGPNWISTIKNSYLKKLITKKYRFIDPLYVVTIYSDNMVQYKPDYLKVREKTEAHLNNLQKNINKCIQKIVKRIDNYTRSYVYGFRNSEYVLEDTRITYNIWYKNLINSIYSEIFDFVETLLDKNVYAVNAIIRRTVFYNSFGSIIKDDIENNEGSKVHII